VVQTSACTSPARPPCRRTRTLAVELHWGRTVFAGNHQCEAGLDLLHWNFHCIVSLDHCVLSLAELALPRWRNVDRFACHLDDFVLKARDDADHRVAQRPEHKSGRSARRELLSEILGALVFLDCRSLPSSSAIAGRIALSSFSALLSPSAPMRCASWTSRLLMGLSAPHSAFMKICVGAHGVAALSDGVTNRLLTAAASVQSCQWSNRRSG
jgi:hypothetical protein